MEVDLYPYTLEGLTGNEPGVSKQGSDECKRLQYCLQGIVVHSGTANYGHYYSYINVDSAWTEFNDAVVRPFDLAKHVQDECFGGTATSIAYDSVLKQNIESSRDITKSAYMLVYARADSISSARSAPATVAEGNSRATSVSTLTLSKSGTALIAAVHEQNVRFLYRRCVMTRTFVDAIAHIVNDMAHKIQGTVNDTASETCTYMKTYLNLTVECGARCATLVASRIPHKTSSMRLYRALTTLAHVLATPLTIYVDAEVASSFCRTTILDSLGRVFCEVFDPQLRNVLACCPYSDIREACGDCLQAVIVGAMQQNDLSLPSTGTRLIDLCTSSDTFDTLAASWRNLQSHMSLLRGIAKASVRARVYMLRSGLLGKLLDFVMGSKMSPVAKVLQATGWWRKSRLPRKQMKARVGQKVPLWAPAIDLALLLVRSIRFLNDDEAFETAAICLLSFAVEHHPC